MSKPYDATVKSMLEESPPDWPRLAGQSPRAVDVIDADISTVSGAADKVLRLHGEPDSIMHFDFQAGPDGTLPRRLHGYNALLEDRHDMLVRSVAVLLRPQADLSNVTGVYERQFPGEAAYLRFHYQVIRVWQLSPDALLKGGLGTLALAPISAVTEAELPGVIERMRKRVRTELPKERAARLWTSTYVLMGLRYPAPVIEELLEGVLAMEESVTYQAIVARGRLAEAKKCLLLWGRRRLGPPGTRIRTAIEAITDPEHLEHLGLRLGEVNSWEDLLGVPQRPRQRKRTS